MVPRCRTCNTVGNLSGSGVCGHDEPWRIARRNAGKSMGVFLGGGFGLLTHHNDSCRTIKPLLSHVTRRSSAPFVVFFGSLSQPSPNDALLLTHPTRLESQEGSQAGPDRSRIEENVPRFMRWDGGGVLKPSTKQTERNTTKWNEMRWDDTVWAGQVN